MTDLASTDVTIAMVRSIDVCTLDSGMKQVLAEVTFGDSALTYPENGVPLPAIGNFDLKVVRYGGVLGGYLSNGYGHDYDQDNHTIRIYDVAAGTEESAAFAPDATTLTLILWGK